MFFPFPETSVKTLEEVEKGFVTGEPTWWTKVQTSRMREIERGVVDEEKVRTYGGLGSNANAESSEDDATVGGKETETEEIAKIG